MIDDSRPSIPKTLLICVAYAFCTVLLHLLTDNRDNEVFFFFTLLLLMGNYAIPSFCAFYRQHPNKWFILLVNIFGGVTGFLWFACLFWALSDYVVGGTPTVNVISPSPDQVTQLQRLSDMRSAGHLTDDEFQSAKQRLLQS